MLAMEHGFGAVTSSRVIYDDLVSGQTNPYNTRFNTSLAPAPICVSPFETVNVALAPDTTDYLYCYIMSEMEKFLNIYDGQLAARE